MQAKKNHKIISYFENLDKPAKSLIDAFNTNPIKYYLWGMEKYFECELLNDNFINNTFYDFDKKVIKIEYRILKDACWINGDFIIYNWDECLYKFPPLYKFFPFQYSYKLFRINSIEYNSKDLSIVLPMEKYDGTDITALLLFKNCEIDFIEL